jgi:hypothetical protein
MTRRLNLKTLLRDPVLRADIIAAAVAFIVAVEAGERAR